MKKIVLSFIFLFALLSCNSIAENKILPAADFDKKLQLEKDVVLIDIRTPEEYKSGYIKNAVNIDWYNNFEDYIQELDKDKTILFYCKSGGRSAEAAKLFAFKGFKKAYELQGGIMSWENANLAVVEDKLNTAEGMTTEQFKEIINAKKLALVDFNAKWCKPCKILSPILDELAVEKKNFLKVEKIDIDQNKPLAKSMEVISLPLLILYKDGKEVWRKNELISKYELGAVIDANNN